MAGEINGRKRARDRCIFKWRAWTNQKEKTILNARDRACVKWSFAKAELDEKQKPKNGKFKLRGQFTVPMNKNVFPRVR